MLGGRSEVINAPISELLRYMESSIQDDENKYKEKQAEMYISYLSQIFSQPLQEKPSQEYINAKKEFEKLLIPEAEGSNKKEINEYKWDFDEAEYMKSIE